MKRYTTEISMRNLTQSDSWWNERILSYKVDKKRERKIILELLMIISSMITGLILIWWQLTALLGFTLLSLFGLILIGISLFVLLIKTKSL